MSDATCWNESDGEPVSDLSEIDLDSIPQEKGWEDDEYDIGRDFFLTMASAAGVDPEEAERVFEENPEKCRKNAIDVFNNLDEYLGST